MVYRCCICFELTANGSKSGCPLYVGRWRRYSLTSHPLYLHANPYTTGRPLLYFLARGKGIENDLELLIDNLLHTNDAPGLVCVSS